MIDKDEIAALDLMDKGIYEALSNVCNKHEVTHRMLIEVLSKHLGSVVAMPGKLSLTDKIGIVKERLAHYISDNAGARVYVLLQEVATWNKSKRN